MNSSYRQLSVLLLFFTGLLVSSNILSCTVEVNDNHNARTVQISFFMASHIENGRVNLLDNLSHHGAQHNAESQSSDEMYSHGDCQCCDDCSCYDCANCDSCGSPIAAVYYSAVSSCFLPSNDISTVKPCYTYFLFPPPGYPPRR